MQHVKYVCDMCEKEYQPQDGTSAFIGILRRMTVELEKVPYQLKQDYCNECSEVVLNFINEFQQDVHTKRGDIGIKHNKQNNPAKK